MFRSLIFVICLLPLSASAAPGNLLEFLKTCGWGTVIGAGLGTISLAFEDKPSDHTINIARGASLGLYGGIAYGVSAMNHRPQKVTPVETWGVAPRLEKGQVSGIDVAGVVWQF